MRLLSFLYDYARALASRNSAQDGGVYNDEGVVLRTLGRPLDLCWTKTRISGTYVYRNMIGMKLTTNYDVRPVY